MNIRDTAKTSETLRVDTAAVRTNQQVAEKPRAERNTDQTSQTQNQDRYVQKTEGFVGSALYSISDVRRSRRIQGENRLQEQRSTLTGKKITEKVLDIILPPGVKNLKIFRTEL
jgi:hypothetical protein